MIEGEQCSEGLSVLSREIVSYEGRDLEAMAEATNYHDWILDIFEPYLGDHLIEVGAGHGSFSEMIVRRHPCRSLRLVEPSASMYESLVDRTRRMTANSHVETFKGTFPELAESIRADERPDSVIYVNVLEHIADDQAELDRVGAILGIGGRILIFVPALNWLYGNFDRRVGHFRRYTKAGIEERLKRAQFKILHSEYFDLPGIVPWWIKYRLFRSDALEQGIVRLYDRSIVPIIRRIELRLPPVIGKNLIVIARKI